MRKLRCIALALLLVFLMGTAAMAVENISIVNISVRDYGTLEVVLTTGYPDPEDRNFTAYTENGDLEVNGVFALAEEAKTWFVILEYGSDNQNENLRVASNEIMKGLARNLVKDKDEGALILCNKDPIIEKYTKAEPFRDVLSQNDHGTTDYKYLPTTLKAVMKYIAENNVVNPSVVVIAQARLLNDDQMRDIREILTDNVYRRISTHIVCPIASSADRTWVSRAEQLKDYGFSTLSGSGRILYIDQSNTAVEADKAVEQIGRLERSKMLLLIDPKVRHESAIGKQLTVKQTTSGAIEMESTVKLDNSDGTYAAWKREIERELPGEQSGGSGNSPEGTPKPGVSLFGSGSSFLYVPPDEEEKPAGISAELLVGIILGVVIIALAAVLLLVKRNKSKTKKTATTVHGVSYAAGSSGSGSSGSGAGTKVTLTAEDGHTVSGTMKNNRLIIGRDGRKGAQLAIPSDGKLSGVHVILEKQGNQLLVTDQHSMNGTKVNGERITGSMLINQNDTLGIGSHNYTVSWRG